MAAYLMAVDAGTGSVRAVLFDTEGRQVSCVQREWFHREDPRYPGSMDFDWTGGWRLAAGCIRGAIEAAHIRPGDIAAVSTTCMREGIVLYDRAGKEIWACANVDARSNDEVAELKRIGSDLERELYFKSGQTFALGALPRLLWVKNKEPALYASIGKMGMFNDWLIYKLSGASEGGVLLVEPSNGSTTGLMSLETQAWDRDIARRCGIRDDIFPETAACGTLAGKVSPEAAALTGLCEGTPLVVGAGDCQAGTIGVGVCAAGQAAVFGGSFWQYEYNSASPAVSPACDVRVNCHALPDMWQFEALAFNPGLVMRWYRDAFCDGADYRLLDEEAAKVPAGSNGMVCAFSDVMNYIAWRHAAPTFMNFGLDAGAFNKYTFYRAIMENTALVTRGHMDLVNGIGASTGDTAGSRLGCKPRSITFAGGAAKSRLWSQIVADALNVEVAVPVVKEATALGAAILAGVGVGVYSDATVAARQIVKTEAVYRPNPEAAAVYEQAFQAWKQAYTPLLDLADRGVTKHMWKAPGL
jgi:autoinducer 2 (AI-2) kinase